MEAPASTQPAGIHDIQLELVELIGATFFPAASRRFVALQRQIGRGKASRLCPRSSDVDLFGYGESVIDLNAEITHRALDLLVLQ